MALADRRKIKFMFKENKFPYLHNLYQTEFHVDGVRYTSVEHYINSKKFEGTKYEELIRCMETSEEAKKEGDRKDLPLRSDWHKLKDTLMYKGVYAKFTQNPNLRARLLETGDAILQENSKDTYWGNGIDNSGKNKLGKIMMKVRDEVREIESHKEKEKEQDEPGDTEEDSKAKKERERREERESGVSGKRKEAEESTTTSSKKSRWED